MEKILSDFHDVFNVSVCESGWEITKPLEGFGPYVRTYYIMHFVIEGKGYYEIDGKKFTVEKNHVFLIPPKKTTTYYADKDTPWKYFWIGFSTSRAEELLPLCGFNDGVYVLPFNNNSMFLENLDMLNGLKRNPNAYDFVILGLLFQAFGVLSSKSLKEHKQTSTDLYVNNAVSFMKNNFSKKLDIQTVAMHVGLERTYFTKIFTLKIGVSPKEYLQKLRLDASKIMLLEKKESLKNIAVDCGFNDYSHFYNAFYKYYKITPKQYIDSVK